MNKFLIFLVALLIPVSALASGGQAVVRNEQFDRNEMKTIHGDPVKLDENSGVVGALDLGLAFSVPEAYSGQSMEGQFSWLFDGLSLTLTYLPDAQVEAFNKLMSITDHLKYLAALTELESQMISLMAVVPLKAGEPGSEKTEARLGERFPEKEVLVAEGDTRILLFYNSAATAEHLGQGEAAKLAQAVSACLPRIKSGLMLFPAKSPAQGAGQGQNTLDEVQLEGLVEGEDMEGKAFGIKELNQYDLTVVNIWGTTCYPCIAELPLLQKLYEALPKNVNLISVCLDGGQENELAQAILKDTGVQFTTLKGDKLADTVLKHIVSTPTTLFLDAAGKPVGPAITGVIDAKDRFVDTGLEIIKERLGMIQGQE